MQRPDFLDGDERLRVDLLHLLLDAADVAPARRCS